jgi:DNA-binding MarR family transcriptional regulator
VPLKLISGLNRAAHRVGTYIAAAPDLEITQAEAQLLSQLAAGAQGLSDLQATYGHKRSTLTSILDRLAARGLITREVPEEDRRSVVVRPTRSGKVVARKSREYLASLETRVARRVSVQALAGYHAVLRAIELETPDG